MEPDFRLVRVSVRVSVGQSVVPNLGAQKRALQAPSNGVPNFSTGRRGFHVTAPRLALLRSKSRRRRAPRPAAGPPTHAIAGTRARAVTMATVRPPSLPESLQAAGNLLCATTLSSLDAAVVTRRRHRVTYFAFPSGGAPAGASLHLRLPLRRRRPRRRVRRLQSASTAPTAPTAARDSRLLRQYARRDVQLGFRRQLQRLRPRLGVPPGPGPTARVPLCIVTSTGKVKAVCTLYRNPSCV